jgi:hypothetical protein
MWQWIDVCMYVCMCTQGTELQDIKKSSYVTYTTKAHALNKRKYNETGVQLGLSILNHFRF